MGQTVRLVTDDPDLLMPPPETKKKLTAQQIAKLKRWIASGAEYQPHWSFIPPVSTDAPVVKNEAWVKNMVDWYVLARLETNGLGGDRPHRRSRARSIDERARTSDRAGRQTDVSRSYKPVMQDWYDKELPESIRMGQRLTTMTSGQARFPVAPSKFKFSQQGDCGLWMNTQLLPNLAKKTDDICWMRSLHTEAINHEPAITALQTGNQVTGRPCLGAWASYGLGSDNENLPAFVVLVATPSNRDQEQAISGRLWSSGYLSGEHAGVSFRSKGDPILYINNPPGVSDSIRERSIEGINKLNQLTYESLGDPQTHTRIQQYEMAFRMQASVPELTDINSEPDHTFKLYGEEAKKPGTFANTVLTTRRLAERGVRFIQVYHNNWDITQTSQNGCRANARTSIDPVMHC